MTSDKAFTFVAPGKADVLHCPVSISASKITTTSIDKNEYAAIWDTGATKSVITKRVADDLNLKPIGMTQVHTAAGKVDCNIYLVDIVLPNNINIQNVTVTEAKLTGFDSLIGMDIIGLGDFAVSNHEGKTMVSYRIPSDGGVDFVSQLQKINNPKNSHLSNPAKSSKTKHKKERQARKKGRRNNRIK